MDGKQKEDDGWMDGRLEHKKPLPSTVGCGDIKTKIVQ